MVNVDAPDTWRIGFITQNDATQFGLSEHVAVYVPLSYALTGVVYFVPKEKIKPITNMNSAEAMKFVISGGVSHLGRKSTSVNIIKYNLLQCINFLFSHSEYFLN